MKKLTVMLVAFALFAPLVASARPFQPLPIIEQVKGCMVKTALNYNAKANYDDGSCVYGGGNPSAMARQISRDMYSVNVEGNKVSVSWLASFNSYGAVLVSSHPSNYALNSFGRVYNGNEAQLGQLGGYDMVIEDEAGQAVFHTMSFTLPAGEYWVRPISWTWDISADYSLGQERLIVIE
jgi:hypothetical protein